MSKFLSLSNPLIAENWGHTTLQIRKISFKWTISNFSYLREKRGEEIESPDFPAGCGEDPKWNLSLFPKGESDEYKDWISVYLNVVSCQKPDVLAMAEFSILDADNEKKNRKKFDCPQKFFPEKSFGFPVFVLRSYLEDPANALLLGDRLTLFCQVTMGADYRSVSGRNSAAVHIQDPERQLSDDLSSLLESQRQSDVVLVCNNGQEFAAHKAILAARSPVFAAMFECDMKEKERGRVEIEDMDPQVLKCMLSCMYSGRTLEIVDKAEDLLVAAEKYALDSLKLLCEEHLSSNLTAVRAAEILMLADQYRADQLKKNAIDFIRIAPADVMVTEGWKDLVKSRPHLVAEVFL